jgi:formylglycine-generating enzyme
MGAPATISGFRLDKYLVTVGRFRQFVGAWNKGSGWLPSAGSGKHTHLNGGLGLVDIAAVSGTYEMGWDAIDWNPNVAPTDVNLTSNCQNSDYATWTPATGSHERDFKPICDFPVLLP